MEHTGTEMDWVSTVASPGVIVGLKGRGGGSREMGEAGWVLKAGLERGGTRLSGWTHLGCSRLGLKSD